MVPANRTVLSVDSEPDTPCYLATISGGNHVKKASPESHLGIHIENRRGGHHDRQDDRSGGVEVSRVLRTTRKTAINCRRATLQQLHATIVASPDEVRDQVRNLTRMLLLRTCASWNICNPRIGSPVSTKAITLAIGVAATREHHW